MRLDGVAFGDVLVLAQDHGADRVALEVQRQAEACCRRELEHLALHRVGQAVDAADAVGHGDHGALVADFGADARGLLIRLLISSLISDGIELHDSLLIVNSVACAGDRAPSGVSAARLHLFAGGRVTEVSSTSSPTTTRTPPISDGSTVDGGFSLRPNAFPALATSSRSCVAVDRERAVRSCASAAPFCGVLQRVELRGDFGQQRQAAVFDQHRARSSSPRRAAATSPATTERSATPARPLTFGLRGELAQLARWRQRCGQSSTRGRTRPRGRRLRRHGTAPRRKDGRWWRVQP